MRERTTMENEETSLHRLYKDKVVEAARELASVLELAAQDNFNDYFVHGANIRHHSVYLTECMAQYRVITAHDL